MRYKILCVLFIVSCCGICLPAFAQTYQFEHLGIEQGMSNNYVTALAQDKRGCIWIGTDAGLNVFDGSRFITYMTENSAIAGDAINTLTYDEKNDLLYIGTRTGLSILNCSTGLFEKDENLQRSTHLWNVKGIALEHNTLWIAKQFGGLLSYDRGTGKPTIHFKKWANGKTISVLSLLYDSQGHLYIGHGIEGMSIFNIRQNRLTYYPVNAAKGFPNGRIYCIYQDSGKRIWLGSDKGLTLFNPKNKKFTNYQYRKGINTLLCNNIYDIKEMNDGKLWIASDVGGINMLDLKDPASFNPQNARFQSITASYDTHGLASSNIRNLLQDSFGNIWIGNHSKGLNFIGHSHSPFHILPAQFQLKPYDPYAVWGLYAAGSALWTGNENSITSFYNNQDGKSIDLSPYLTKSHSHVFTITQIGNDLLLGLYRNGLLKLNLATQQIRRIQLPDNEGNINSFYKDNDGKIWIGTVKGLYLYNNGTVTTIPALASELSTQTIYGIQKDSLGNLWIGTYGSGIYIFDRHYKQRNQLSLGEGFPSNVIHQFLLDSKGGMWVATKNGLVYFPDVRTPQHYITYTTRNGLMNNYVHALQEDNTGNIWLSTDKGISCFNRREKEFKHFESYNDIPMNSFVDGSACKALDGTLYFGSLNGVCFFNPQNFTLRRAIAPVQIISCERFKTTEEDGSETALVPIQKSNIQLNYNQNTFRLFFSVTDYALNDMIDYAYMLEGNNNNWIGTQGESSVIFSNLASGTYTFKVKARLKSQTWDNNHIATIRIHIRPPFYWSWYAWLFYLLAVVGGVFIWLRSYKRKLQLESSLELERKKVKDEKNIHEERLRFFTNIAHELRTPLTLIIGPLEDLTQDSGLSEKYSHKTGLIYKNAMRLLNLVNQLLDFRKTETYNRELTVTRSNLAQQITDITLRFKEAFTNQKVQFITDIDTQETVLYYDREIMTTILTNLLSNAVKYTPEGTITIRLSSVNEDNTDFTEISVKDTGYGIDKDDLPHIFERYYQAKGKYQASGTGIGLALVKSLIILHEGSIQVKSEPGKGTEFIVRLQTNNTYPNVHHQETVVTTSATVVATEATAIANPLPSYTNKTEILVIEDNDDIRQYIADSLSGTYIIFQARNGKEGLEIAQKNVPDIIITDIMMPVMNGLELCKAIKTDIYTSHIPVILLTAKNSLQDKEEGYENGADSYLTKPFSTRLLQLRIQNLLISRQKTAERIKEDLKRPITPMHKEGLDRTSREFIDTLMTVIEENIAHENLDIEFLSEKMNMSRSSLYRKIKGITGMSGNELVKKFKLKHSIKLMVEEERSISEAAYASGFNDLNYFRICFKKEYGMTPTEYLNNHYKK